MTNNSTERSFEQSNHFSAPPPNFHSDLFDAWKNDRALLAQLPSSILPPVFESSPSNRAAGVIARDTGSPILAHGNDGFELVDHSRDIAQRAPENGDNLLLAHRTPAYDKPSTGAAGIASYAEDLHEHHSSDFHNHGNVYTCAMFVNRALAEAGYKLNYEKGENHNMVHNLDHSLAHNKHFEKVPTHPYEPKVGDVVIFGDHHSGIITAIGSEGPILTYGGSTQTGKTASTPLKLLENSPGFAGAPTHVYRCKDTH
jgi:hypothetical protein